MTSRIGSELRRVGRHWETHGAADPLWAVYVADGTRGGQWDVTEFFATGQAEVTRVLAPLDAIGLPASRKLGLDFGCGVGRLSRALADHVDRVIGVDVSAPMLQRARDFALGDDRLEFVLNRNADLSFVADDTVDLVYSSLVLQHMSRPLAATYLSEFVRVLSPGGVAIVQVATRPTASIKGVLFGLLPAGVLGWLQRRLLKYPAPMRMQAMSTRWMHRRIARAGGRVISEDSDTSYGGHWVYRRYVFTARA